MKRVSIREAQVLKFIENGYTLSQIAIKLNVSKNSINSYKRRALRKLSCVYANL